MGKPVAPSSGMNTPSADRVLREGRRHERAAAGESASQALASGRYGAPAAVDPLEGWIADPSLSGAVASGVQRDPDSHFGLSGWSLLADEPIPGLRPAS